jgi:L-lactate dehydrogenase complex protein LldF
VITPNMRNMKEWKHLSYASSLCGNCTEVCAVKINLHELLLDNRHEAVEEGASGLTERIAWKVWKNASLNRKMMNRGSGSVKNWVVNKLIRGWSKHRAPLQFPEKTFNQMWMEKKG